MKILVTSQYPLFASTTNRMLGFAKALAKRGHKVTLLITGNKYVPGTPKTPLPKEIEGVCIKQTPSLPESFVVMPSFVSGILAIFLIVLFKIPIAIFHSLFHEIVFASKPLPYGAIVTLVARFVSRTPFVLDTDDWEGVGGFATIKQGKRALVKAIITYFEEKVPLKAKAVVAASKLLAERTILSGVPREAVFVAPNGADLVKFNPIIDGTAIRRELGLDGVVFSYLGTFKKGGANWKMLIDSFHVAYQKTQNIMLLVIGFGYELDNARDYAKSLGLEQCIVFAGKVDHENVPTYLAACDVCLLPYQDDFPHTFLNQGRSSVKLYEYMAMGKAIVGTAVGEVAEALKEGAGVLVKTNDPEDFGQTMAMLFQDSERISQLGQAARQHAETVYNYDSMSEVVEKALQYALGK